MGSRATVSAMALAVIIGLIPSATPVASGSWGPARPRTAPQRPEPPPVRPPQFIAVGFDGAGGKRGWDYWLSVARETHAHFTFFVSGAYLLDWAHRDAYRPPMHARGSSSIGFGQETGDLTVENTVDGITAGYKAGQEIGTHFVGHFCSPDRGSVGHWSSKDWQSELGQFDTLLFKGSWTLPFGPSEIVGSRSPCLEGKPAALYPVLKRNGIRYDTSQTAPLGTWPSRVRGIWSFPLLEIPFVGHTFKVLSMDYNFFANQVGESRAKAESETYRSLWNAFVVSYRGGRAPLSIGQHFETWSGSTYNRALRAFLVRACAMPEVRCVSFRELADFLDAVPPRRLHRYLAGTFPRMSASTNHR